MIECLTRYPQVLPKTSFYIVNLEKYYDVKHESNYTWKCEFGM